MDRLWVEDFYDWHPSTLMASKSHYDIHTSERTTVRLYSEIDYETEEITYKVSVSHNDDIDYTEFHYLFNAVDFYNNKLS